MIPHPGRKQRQERRFRAFLGILWNLAGYRATERRGGPGVDQEWSQVGFPKQISGTSDP